MAEEDLNSENVSEDEVRLRKSSNLTTIKQETELFYYRLEKKKKNVITTC